MFGNGISSPSCWTRTIISIFGMPYGSMSSSFIVEEGSLRAEIEVNDTQLYGKFLVEWDRVISDLEKFVDERTTIPQRAELSRRCGGRSCGGEGEGSAREQSSMKIPNILTPRNQMTRFDPKTTKRYTDGTLRGAPDIKRIAYEIASTCDGGKTFNKLPSKSVPIFLSMPSTSRESSCSDQRAEALSSM